MRVLVTGSHGYIGSILVDELAAAGHDVGGLDTFFYEGCDFAADAVGCSTLRADVRDVSSRDLLGFDAVVHLAALSNDPVGDLSPDWTRSVNLEGTVHLARCAKEAGISRFVLASSCSMYGAASPEELLDEDAPLRPLTPYAESKVRAEEALFELADDEFAPVSMRNATVYGVSPRLRLDVVLNNLVAWAHTSGKIRLLSDGSSWRPLVHVRDLSRAALALLSGPVAVTSRGAFNVGSADQNYLVRDLASTVADVTGCDVEFAQDASPDPRSYRVDFSKLMHAFPELDFEWNAQRGCHELLVAFRANALTSAQFEGRRYVRIRQLKYLLDNEMLDGALRWATHSSPDVRRV